MGTLKQDFWARVKVGHPSQCWPWTGPIARNGGHGTAKTENGTTTTAHRLAYILAHGPVPKGMVLCHSCDNAICCNPSHLTPGSQQENMRQMIARGRGKNQYGTAKGPSRRQRLPRSPQRIGVPIAIANLKRTGVIWNICGPPGAGKSELLAAVGIKTFKIDDYRSRLYINADSWAALVNDVLRHDGTAAIESSGLSSSLSDLRSAAVKQGRDFRTIIITAPIAECLERTSKRPPRNMGDVSFSITDLINECIKLPQKWPGASAINNCNGNLQHATDELLAILNHPQV